MATTFILGAGIIGTSTAYYLSKHQPPSTIHLVEVSPELFASASGFAGGFLAKDWFSPEVAELGALSFEEHKRLADQENGAEKWGYSRTTPIAISSASTKSKEKLDPWFHNGSSRAEAASGNASAAAAPQWLWNEEGNAVEVIGEENTVAQLDPFQLCQYLMKKCVDSGVHLHHPAKVVSMQTDAQNKISSVHLVDAESSKDIPCTNVIIAAGSWSPEVFQTLFPNTKLKLPISSLAGHSLVVKSPRWEGVNRDQQRECHAVFLATQPGYSPELFSRLNGQIFVGGLNSATEPLPALATDSKQQISKTGIERLRETCREVLGQGQAEDDLEVVREGLCFRPITESGVPIVGRIPDEWTGLRTEAGSESGVYLASGHGPWGISLGLGTGKVLAELVQGREQSANIFNLGLKA